MKDQEDQAAAAAAAAAKAASEIVLKNEESAMKAAQDIKTEPEDTNYNGNDAGMLFNYIN